MSPFERVVDEIGVRVAALDRRAQVALLSAASRALRPAYRRWVLAARTPDHDDLLDEAGAIAERFSVDGVVDVSTKRVAADIALKTPGDGDHEALGLTAAQDCWILAEAALKVAAGAYRAEDATWYLVEPSFQATLARLFGVTDPGSDRQDAAETRALADTELNQYLNAVRRVIDQLDQAQATRPLIEELAAELGVLSVHDRPLTAAHDDDSPQEQAEWTELRTVGGPAGLIPEALGRMLHAPSAEDAARAYWELDNHVVVQGQLFSAAERLSQELIARLCSGDYTAEGLSRAIDLLVELANGESDESEVLLGNDDLGDRCRQHIALGLDCIKAIASSADERTVLAVVDLVDRLSDPPTSGSPRP